MDGKPFLRVSEQGYSGSGLSSEVEHWIDLSRPEFDPVFSFTPQGVEHRLGFGISRTVHAHAIADRDETIRVVVTLRYTGYAESIELGRAELTATYQRLVGRRGFALRDVTQGASATTVATEKFEKLINLDEGGASNAMLIAEALPGLKKIALGDNADAKGWLRHMLSKVKDTPEKQVLMKLLDER